MNEVILISVVVGASFLAALWFNWHKRKLRKENVLNAFSKFIYRKTLDALIKDGEASPLHQDGQWIRTNEKDLVARYGSQWIAVVNTEVLAAASTGETAWEEALTKCSSRVPFVKKLDLEHINWEFKQSSTG